MKPSYEQKFEGLLNLCKDAKTSGTKVIVIASSEALGDDYSELVESLNRISDAGLHLSIVPRSQR